MLSKHVPQNVPCPACGQVIEVPHVILEFGDATVIPLACKKCRQTPMMVEVDEDVFMVHLPELYQMEMIAHALKQLAKQVKVNAASKWN